MSKPCLPLAALVLSAALTAATLRGSEQSFAGIIDQAQPKMVKIYGSGGIRGLEDYQSGILVSPDGHVLTVFSYVLDSEEYLKVVLNDGQRFDAKLVSRDPRLEIALLKIEASGLPHYALDDAVELQTGSRVLAFSNLFGVATGDEPASVLHGSVAAVTELMARRGAFRTTYRGSVYVLDAITNNPGAAGGALTDGQGNLAGLLGKELRNSLSNTWLNYAIPIAELKKSVDDMLAGRAPQQRDDENEARKPNQPHTLAGLGIVLLPDVLPKTPPFVEEVRAGSLAEEAGLRTDDLILFVNDQIASSYKGVVEELSYIDRIDKFRLTVQRGNELVDVQITPRPDR